MERTSRYWFAAKRYGWGWGRPLTWEGWVVYTLWFVSFICATPFLGLRRHLLPHLAIVVGMIAILIGICYWKGEPARWRWGDE